MNTHKTIGCLLAAIILFTTFVAEAGVTVFVNVNVLPMSSEEVLTQQSVVVTDGRISQIGDVDSVEVPKGADLVDGTDRFLIPGLAEMHAHVTSTAPEQVDRLSTLFVANGITTIRGMLGRADLQLERPARPPRRGVRPTARYLWPVAEWALCARRR